MSKTIPPPGTTVILRKRVGRDPFDWNFNNDKYTHADAFAVIREVNHHDVRMQLLGQQVEIYIPKRFITSKGSDLASTPPIISIPASFTIETLPL